MNSKNRNTFYITKTEAILMVSGGLFFLNVINGLFSTGGFTLYYAAMGLYVIGIGILTAKFLRQ